MREKMESLLNEAVVKNASDLHITVGRPPVLRINGELQDIGEENIDSSTAKSLIYSVLTQKQIEKFEDELELDFAYEIHDISRFRVNVYRHKGVIGAAFRVIQSKIL